LSGIHPANTEVFNSSIAWDIGLSHRTGYYIIIRSVCLDGVEIAGDDLPQSALAELRDVVKASPEYDPAFLTQLVRDLRYEAEMDERADRTRQGGAA
jgi:hypothetical protein